jgi:SAM-dependent methyltransferase
MKDACGKENIGIKMVPSNHDKSLFSFQDPEDFHRLRGVLEAAGYTDAGILEALGVKDFPSIRGDDIPLLLRRTNQGTPLDTLIRLFLIEMPCDIEALRRAIRPTKLEKWVEAGLVQIDGESVVAAVKLLPFQNLVLAFDLPGRLQTAMGQDYVMGVASSTLTLANLTVRRHASLTLDLGTGSGIQALLAARHSDRVLAVDLNPRAVRLAAFNAKLNEISNVEWLQGDLFEPARGHSFDLVISNPPFVISPEMRYTYRDSGMEADRICRKIVRLAPEFLREGGYCQILCNWAEYTGQDWRERLASWFEGTGCDAWVIGSETRDAGTYASTWIRHTERAKTEHFAQRFEEWMAYYEEQRIHAISGGLITMRRSSGHANWFRADDAPEKMLGPCGEHIVLGFELRDFLETVRDDSTLLNTGLRVSPDVRLERQCVPSAEGWVEEAVQLHLTRGPAYSGRIDPYVANLVIGCDGERRLGDLVAEMAASLGVDPANMISTVCGVVRRLIERGFLLPANFVNRNV